MERKHDSFFLADKKQKQEFKKDKEQYKNKKVHFKNNSVKPEKTEELSKARNKRKEEFNKNRPGLDQEGVEKVKKPFDKKAYRLKKYSKKYKLDQFEEQRKKKLLRNYYKEVQNEPTTGTYKVKNFDEEDTTDGQETAGRFVKHPDLIEKENNDVNTQKQNAKKDPLAKAKERFNKIKQGKIEKQKEIEKAKEERMQKLQEYKKKKQERFKKLSKKTKKGQPVMTGRLELLLEKIQKNK